MAALRSDAARSRERILSAARGADPTDLRLNEIAREAGVGVGTVYRHFPTTHALLEELTRDALARLGGLALEALADPDPGHAFESMLREVVRLQIEAAGLQTVLLADTDVSPEIAELKAAVFSRLAAVLERAQRAGVVRPELTPVQVQHLVCGVEYAVRLGVPEDRDMLVDTVVAGLRVA